MIDWNSRTISGYGCGPRAEPSRYVVSCGRPTQSRIASLMASFRVRLPASTPTTVAPSSRMRTTFSACRAMSSVPM